MLFMTRAIVVIWMIGCLHSIVPFVRALPPEGENAGIPSIPGDLLGGISPNSPGESPPAPVEVTNDVFNLAANSDGAIFKDSITQTETAETALNNALQFETSSGVGNSGTAGGAPLSLQSFNTPLPSSQSTNTQIGASSTTSGSNGGIIASSVLKNSINPSTSAGRIGSTGFLARVAGSLPIPRRISGVRITPVRMGNTVRLSNNRPRQTGRSFLATLINPPTRTSSTFNTVPGSSRIMSPFAVPASSQSFTFQPMNFERPPSMSNVPMTTFTAPAFSPPVQTTPSVPFVALDSAFPPIQFSAPSVEVPTVPALPPPMTIQNIPNSPPIQTFTASEPPRVTFSPATPSFVTVNPPTVPSQSSAIPQFSTFVGPSFQSGTFSTEPETSVTVLPPIIVNEPPTTPLRTIGIELPPAPIQVQQSSLMASPGPITVTPLAPIRFDAPQIPSPTSIPVSFQTSPAFSVPNFAPFTSPLYLEGTRLFGFNTVPPIVNQAGGNIGIHMSGTGGVEAAAAAGGARAQRVMGTGGMFSAAPFQPLLPVLPRLDVRPALSTMQAF